MEAMFTPESRLVRKKKKKADISEINLLSPRVSQQNKQP